ncbi:hypothetical protein Patl1_08432 [Pistacia atlantica]|uniref:Uncharacterized protein n=1 Tax=Pistacia atlantica TaxID=434234 RepID=A0ACC1ADI7_9ROSI|nr:hypothetical protein Patl1_08432 [Pistacia atlantica]
MAASVDNRQFNHLESTLNGFVRPYKSGPNHRPDSPVRSHNTFSTPKKQFFTEEDDSSSEDENETGYKDMIRKGNSELEPSILDSRDEGTADNWIERNSSMVRLTGKHPFNSEPPLTRLMHHGFITPIPLHYVRNHGTVPKATWDDWTVEITGLVKRPSRFTMEQLVNEFSSSEFPVTLVCAGNRRKEQNMVKQTIGFNWGAAGNLHFGAEDLPGGGGSKYGTSIKKEFAMDPSRDIILAYMQNGERLSPDHGFPSDNYYHYKDNRVLPSHVDAELANAEAWWYKPEHVINELNINSVITTPCHEEILPINSWTTQKAIHFEGLRIFRLSYFLAVDAGIRCLHPHESGGKKVTRVEVTMDGGETWHVCTLDHPEKPNKYGKYWCWCFWSLEVEVLDLLGAKEIAVRAWDETHNTQPEKLIWNVMPRNCGVVSVSIKLAS